MAKTFEAKATTVSLSFIRPDGTVDAVFPVTERHLSRRIPDRGIIRGPVVIYANEPE